MIAADFKLFDVLNCCHVAVTGAMSGHEDAAGAALLEASAAGAGLFPDGSDTANAVLALTAAAGNSGDWPGFLRSWLANALDAACHAVLWAMEGDASRLPEAEAAAKMLSGSALEGAFTVILREIRSMAEAGPEVKA